MKTVRFLLTGLFLVFLLSGVSSARVIYSESFDADPGSLVVIREHSDSTRPGETFEVTITINYDGALTALGIQETIPDSWSFVSSGGDDAPPIKPVNGATGTLEFGWITPPESPIEFIYTIQIPDEEEGEKVFNGQALYRRDLGELTVSIPDTTVDIITYHNADYNSPDWIINLSELLRIIQFYNLNGYYCDPGSEDGFTPGTDGTPGDPTTETVFSEAGNLRVERTYPSNYTGSPVQILLSVEHDNTLNALGIQETIPTGWSFASVSGDDPPSIKPSAGATGTLEFGWISPPTSPISFTYTLQMPGNETGDKSITGQVLYRYMGGELSLLIPESIIEEITCNYHNGDYNPADWSISLSELLRVIQFYNIGSYHRDSEGEDGYNPGP